jgi:hypothetical protein
VAHSNTLQPILRQHLLLIHHTLLPLLLLLLLLAALLMLVRQLLQCFCLPDVLLL